MRKRIGLTLAFRLRQVFRPNRWRGKGFDRRRRENSLLKRYLLPFENAPLRQVVQQRPGGLLRGQRRDVERQLGGGGGLVGVVDAGEPRKLAGAGLLVEPLGVALLAGLDWRGHVDL